MGRGEVQISTRVCVRSENQFKDLPFYQDLGRFLTSTRSNTRIVSVKQ